VHLKEAALAQMLKQYIKSIFLGISFSCCYNLR